MIIDFSPEMTLSEQVVAFRLNLSVVFMSGGSALRYQIKENQVPHSMLEQLNRFSYADVVDRVVARAERRYDENFSQLLKAFSVLVDTHPVRYSQFGVTRASDIFIPTHVAAKRLSLSEKIGYHSQMVTGANVLSRALYLFSETPLEGLDGEPMDYKRLRKFFPAVESI
jgi:hypothetical protein